jgi:hypothetical protein
MENHQRRNFGDRKEIIILAGTLVIFTLTLSACARVISLKLTQESSQLNPAAIEYKTYCPGIGLVQDQSLVLTSYGNE